MKKLSNLELSELIYMASAMCDQIERFKHVSDKAPAKLKKDIQTYYNNLCKEQERRENEN